MSLDGNSRLYTTWKDFEESISNKWIRDTKMGAMNKI
jgi:hypothetical protein